MEMERSNLVKHNKSLNAKQEIIHSSVSFSGPHNNPKAGLQNAKEDLFQEIKEAISSGDDSTWRMWR